jgi:Ca2+-binding RTX toxin-like protein
LNNWEIDLGPIGVVLSHRVGKPAGSAEEGIHHEQMHERPRRQLGLAAVVTVAVGFSAAENAGTASLANRTLTITGTNGPDAVTLDADATTAQVGFGDNAADVHFFNLADFDAISASLGNSDDYFSERSAVLANKVLTVDGGNANDTITTGEGKDTIFGGNGDDTVDAGRGNDNVILGNGNDFFVWNPGEAATLSMAATEMLTPCSSTVPTPTRP